MRVLRAIRIALVDSRVPGKALAEALVNIPSQPTVVAVGRREERLKALEQASGGKIKGLVCVLVHGRRRLRH